MSDEIFVKLLNIDNRVNSCFTQILLWILPSITNKYSFVLHNRDHPSFSNSYFRQHCNTQEQNTSQARVGSVQPDQEPSSLFPTSAINLDFLFIFSTTKKPTDDEFGWLLHSKICLWNKCPFIGVQHNYKPFLNV